MTRYAWLIGLVAVIMTAVAGTNFAVADGHANAAAQKAVKARQAHMQLYSFYLGQLADMAKGAAAYDSATASALAQNLLGLTKMNTSSQWPPGTGNDNAALKGKTRALPEIWSTYPKVAEKGAALTAALEKMAGEAGKDLASLQATIGPVGEGCGGCHKPFRADNF